MNFTNSSATKTSSYRTSYYGPSANATTATTKYSRSPFNSHAQQYHPRLINSPSSNISYTTSSTTATVTTTASSATHNHIKKNYHFSAKSSELFIKKKDSKCNSRMQSQGTATISFSSQHTPQSFIANKTKIKQTRWKRGRERDRERYKDSNSSMSTWRRHNNNNNNHRQESESESRSRSRSRSKPTKQMETDSETETESESNNNANDIEMSITDSDINGDHNNQYIIKSKDIHCYYNHKCKHKTKHNYAKQEILRRIKVKKTVFTHKNTQKTEKDEDEKYHQDINDSDYAIYEMPYKKPKFMKKIKEFVSTQNVPQSVIRRIDDINSRLFATRNKKHKQREHYILVERTHSAHWNQTPTKCWFYRCVDMLEGQVSTMCASPQFCGGVSYPKKPLDEIEKKLARIHPLPPLIYLRLFKTLANLANLMKTYPDAVKWDSNKLQSVFEKAIRKQQQMKTIYNFKTDANFIEYDFAPFRLPQIETNNITFYHSQHHQNNNKDNNEDMDENEDDDILLTDDNDDNEGEEDEDDDDVDEDEEDEFESTPVLSTNLKKKQDIHHKHDKNNNKLMMETPFDLNLDLVRKTKVNFCNTSNAKHFVISPKIEKLVTANCATINQMKIKQKHRNKQNAKHELKAKPKLKEKEKSASYQWSIEKIDSEDESADLWLKRKKEALKSIIRNGGVYGNIKAIGLEPTQQEIPTLYSLPTAYRSLNEKRLPSINYLISHYVDANNWWYIRLLLKYFEIEADPTHTFTCKQIRKYIAKEPKCIKRTFIGTMPVKQSDMCLMKASIVLQMYLDIESVQYYVRFKLNENKRHKLLCTLLRMKNKQNNSKESQKKRKRKNIMCIPQPPPPHNTICVDFNWNGFCDTTFCNKKHECSCCGDKHAARICRKQCVDYNWSKCHRICPNNKVHSCSQCRDNKHPAWRCPYLHKSVTERYYAIYKTKKVRDGYFKQLEKKERRKNIEWIHRKGAKLIKPSANSVHAHAHSIHMKTVQMYHRRHNQKTKKRKHA